MKLWRRLALMGSLAAVASLAYVSGRVSAQRALITPDEINTVEVTSSALKAVVRVDVRIPKAQLQPGEDPIETGSGFFYKPNLIITNYHVVQYQESITVTLYDGRTVNARLEGVDPGIDVAILRVSGVNAPKTLQFGSSAQLIPGQKLMVIGAPFRYQNSISTGIFSTTARTPPPGEDIGLEIPSMLLTTASIQFGNSGGPVLNSRGAVVGIADANLSSNNLAPGLIGLAVPSDLVAQSVEDLEKVGVPQRGTLGVSLVDLGNLDPAFRRGVGLTSSEGALVDEVPAGSTGARAGLRGSLRNAQGQLVTLGDVIVSVDGNRVRSQFDVIRLVASKRPGEYITLKVWRNKREVNVRAQLLKRTLQ
ncbi:S1C family serine protease [Deinococcus peraridilitoris]|uniref:S1C family serine protease n=1 Tax=Deinococcus peraridilitoris TaxID=432329 RepID=UPI001FDF3231|nr:S1C family serine protease [Deinococcus peraridilitoris]